MINQAFVYGSSVKLFVDNMTFGDWLRLQITEKNLSNAEVARRAKVSPTYIGNLVRDFSPNTKDGKGRPSEDVVAAIVKAVSGDLDEARLAAGYAPENTSTGETHDILEGVTVSFDRKARLTKTEQQRILDAMRMVAAGAKVQAEENKDE